MSAEVSFDSSSIQMILIIGLIVLVGIYFYYENFKLKNKLLEIEFNLSKLNDLIYSENKTVTNTNTNTNTNIENNINHQSDLIEKEDIYDQKNDILTEEITENSEWDNIHEQMHKDSMPDIIPNIGPDATPNDISDIVEESNEKEVNKDTKILDSNQNVELLDINIDDMLKDISLDNTEKEEIKDINYNKMTVSQLKNILIEKNLPVSGNKTKLVQRILDNSE